MEPSRDDFIIAIRSAFLKKSTQQKFSLLTLVFVSIFIIILSTTSGITFNTALGECNLIIFDNNNIPIIKKTIISDVWFTRFNSQKRESYC